MKILAINPGSTSTKIAVYEDETPLLVRNIRHTVEELAVFLEVTDQFEFRKSLVLTELEKEGIPFRFDAIIGRGGLVKPIPGGVYEVNEAMRQDTLHAMRTHACNLGCLIADELASMLPGCRAFIADPGVVDEMDEIGYEDYIYGEGVSLIEWANLIEEILPEHYTEIKIEKDLEKGFDYRRITICEY